MVNKTINFVSQGNSYLASHRMRVQKPTELINVGIEDGLTATIRTEADKNADVNIFFKHFDQKGNLQSVMQKETPTVFDVCDDHFDREMGVYYKKMCQLADVITCNTKAMKERIKEVVGRTKDVFVIPDPYTFEIQEPQFIDENLEVTPKLLWFGNIQNYVPMNDLLNHLGSRVTVITNNQVPHHPNVDFIPWKPLVVENQIKEHDIVLIPTNKDDDSIKTKSPNRAIDALAAGKFVITDNEEIYGDLKKYIWITKDTDDWQKAIEFWQNDYPKVRKMILNGQKHIKKNHGNDKIIDGWLDVFKYLGIIKDYTGEGTEDDS